MKNETQSHIERMVNDHAQNKQTIFPDEIAKHIYALDTTQDIDQVTDQVKRYCAFRFDPVLRQFNQLRPAHGAHIIDALVEAHYQHKCCDGPKPNITKLPGVDDLSREEAHSVMDWLKQTANQPH